MPSVQTILSKHRVIPVVSIEHAEHVLPLIDALQSGGITCIEITLRTAQAIEAIKLAKQQRPHTCIAAGTVCTIDQLLQLQALDVDFIVSPGTTDELLAATQQLQIPYLPGVMTASEIMRCAEHGLNNVKLFPAQLAGGINALKSYQQVFAAMQFCPTGGININNANDFLALDNVIALGGSWIAPPDLIEKQQWATISDLAMAASKLC